MRQQAYWLAGLVWLYSLPAFAIAPELELKAAFLYNFIQYVEWPPAKPLDVSAFNLCLLGGNPFDDAFSAIQAKTHGHVAIILKQPALSEINRDCHMLFIGAETPVNLPQILAASGEGVLTVADTEGYAEAGVMINLVMRQHKLRFQINLTAAKRVGLQISAHLLRLAETVF